MNGKRMLGLILDVGKELIRCGGETHRVEDTLYRLAACYSFTNCNIWVIPTNIQATVTTPDGEVVTQVRNIQSTGMEYDRLCRLNELSRWACRETPDEDAFEARLREIRQSPYLGLGLQILGCALGGWGFGLFFGCDLLDSLIAMLTSVCVCLLIHRISSRERNPLVLNFVISFLMESLIILSSVLGAASHMGYITIGVVMLLISGLGTTNGLRDLVHLDTLSGLINLTSSFTGAIGIALGISLPLMIVPLESSHEITSLNSSTLIQILSCLIACTGFSIWFHIKGWKIVICALGGALTWGSYLIASAYLTDLFGSIMIASITCGLYGQIMARLVKTPATVFSTTCLLPLIPGGSLYYMMYGIVTKDAALARGKGIELFLTCFGIVLGYMVVEVVNRYLWKQKRS